MRTRILWIGLAAISPLPVVGQSSVAPECAATAAARPVREGASLRARVPFISNNHHVFVTVCHEGRELSFILDTGAPSSFFDLDTAREQGVPFGAAFSARGAGAGSVAGARIERTPVRIAVTDIDHPIASAIDFSGVTPREGHRLDGVLGGDFFERFVVRIDYVRRTVELHDPETFRWGGAGVAVPMTIRSREPHVDIELALADGERVRGHMLIDVGGSGAFSLRRPWIEEQRLRGRIAPTVRAYGGSGVGGATFADVGRVPEVRIGDVSIAAPIVRLYGDSAGYFSSGGPADGTIGGDVLRRFIVTFDYARRQVIFEPHAGTSEPFEADMSGLTLGMDPELTTIVVQHVLEGSPAAAAGLAPGDTIVAVAGEPSGSALLDRLRARFRRADERVELTVRRGNDVMRRVLITRRVI